MNYVAHLFLANPTDEHRIGSLLADFSVGTMSRVRQRYGKRIAEGVRHHRAIDRYTDAHPSVVRAVEAIKGDFGLYSGIIVDVVFDHFLLRHWHRYSEQPPEQFFDEVYRSLARTDWSYPKRYALVVERMLEKRWLASYVHIENVGVALRRMSERLSRPSPLRNALPMIQASYQTLEACFLDFFPELMAFAKADGMQAD